MEFKNKILSRALKQFKNFKGDNKHHKDFIDRMGTDLFDIKLRGDRMHIPKYNDSLKDMDSKLQAAVPKVAAEVEKNIADNVGKLKPKDITTDFEKQPIFSSVLDKLSNT